MARPIKETPVLDRKDAAKFHSMVKKNQHKKVSRAEYSRAQDLFKNFKVI